ncbi:MAG: orotate phosphoribosyltransferase [Bacteroidetes bacterium]|nr:orotate phosphoribosyltransferase [Bacteroidota bacterium]
MAAQVADYLLEIKAVILRPNQPFRWASGWNSPIYCDNRIILSHPKVRTFVIDSFVAAINKNFAAGEVIAGVATAGIAHAALIADKMNLPMAYVRAKAKEHGTEKMIEGRITPGQKVVMIEDLISTGKSSLAAADSVREAGANVLGLAAVFTYNFSDSVTAFEEKKVPLVCLSGYDILVERATEKGYIKSSEISLLEEWRKNPSTWGR